jgi:hypothetical protein
MKHNVWGIDFDYSDLTFSSIYCSSINVYHTSNIGVLPFVNLTSNSPTPVAAFNNFLNSPTNTNPNLLIDTIAYSIDLACSKVFPFKLYFNIAFSVSNQFLYTFEYDKNSSNPFPNNFTFLNKISTGANGQGKQHNNIKFSQYNQNLFAFTQGQSGSYAAIYVYDIFSNSIVNSKTLPHADPHRFDFSSNYKLIGANDGGCYSLDLSSAPATLNVLNGIGLAVTNVTGARVWEKDGKTVIAGMFDNHTNRNFDINNPLDWHFLFPTGDGRKAEYSPDGSFYFNSDYNTYCFYDAATTTFTVEGLSTNTFCPSNSGTKN